MAHEPSSWQPQTHGGIYSIWPNRVYIGSDDVATQYENNGEEHPGGSSWRATGFGLDERIALR
jgi:hypothetical protein